MSTCRQEIVSRDTVSCLPQPQGSNIERFAMLHRHLNHQGFTLAAIDDIIARGKLKDWADLRRMALADRAILEKVSRVCKAHIDDPYAQRYHFWNHYADRHLGNIQKR
jgi:hypothetical protein